MFNTKTKSLLLVLVMLVAGVFGAAGAATYDNETTDTASTSDLVGGETVTDLDNSSVNKTIEVQSDNASSGDDFTLQFVVNDSDSDQDGDVIHESTDSWTATNSTAGYYNYTFDHATVFDDLERGADEVVTIDVKTVVNESETTEEVATITIDAQNDNTYAVVSVNEGESGTDVADAMGSFSFNFFGDGSAPGAAQTTQAVSVNATNTTEIHIRSSDTNVSDSFSESTADASSGDFLGTTTATVAGARVPVFYESSDVSWVDTSEDAYATQSEDGDITVHNADQLVDSDGTVTVTATANEELGFLETRGLLSDYGAGPLEQILTAQEALDTNGDPFDG